jgi:hypothetical protein
MSATTTRTAGPRTPPPAPSKRPNRFPLYADQPKAPSAPPPSSDRLSETAIAPLGQQPAIAPEPEPEPVLRLQERVARMIASGDPTWLMSFGVLVGALVAVFVLGLILVLV